MRTVISPPVLRWPLLVEDMKMFFTEEIEGNGSCNGNGSGVIGMYNSGDGWGDAFFHVEANGDGYGGSYGAEDDGDGTGYGQCPSDY